MKPDPAPLTELLRGTPAGGEAPISVLGAGDDCTAYAIGDLWVVRVAKHAGAAEGLRREACVLPAIASRLPLPVPLPRHYSVAGVHGISLHERLPGIALSRERWYALPERLQAAAAAALGGFLAALHSLGIGPGHRCGLPRHGEPEDVELLRARARGSLWERLPPDGRRDLDRVFERALRGDFARTYGPALLHGDLDPSHVLHDPARGVVTGVIDFGDLMIGDPARDFVYVFEDYDPAILSRVLEHYPREPPDSLLPRVRFWYLYEAVEWALWMIEGRIPGDVEESIAGIAHEARALNRPDRA